MHNGQQERIRLNGIDCPEKRRWMDVEEKVTKLLKAFKCLRPCTRSSSEVRGAIRMV